MLDVKGVKATGLQTTVLGSVYPTSETLDALHQARAAPIVRRIPQSLNFHRDLKSKDQRRRPSTPKFLQLATSRLLGQEIHPEVDPDLEVQMLGLASSVDVGFEAILYSKSQNSPTMWPLCNYTSLAQDPVLILKTSWHHADW